VLGNGERRFERPNAGSLETANRDDGDTSYPDE
jgi:hypothetical protein